MRAAILAYHRVADFSPDGFALCTPPEIFRAQLGVLAAAFQPAPLDELLRAPRAGAVAVTLDDGTVDALTTAAPLLTAARVPATFFASSGAPGAEWWWDRLERAVAPARLAAEHAALLPLAAADRGRALAALEGAPPPPRATHRTLTVEELRALADLPDCSIGAHTLQHLHLPSQPPEIRRAEMQNDRRALAALLGREVSALAYPFGAHDAATVEDARAAGFSIAVTVEPRALAPNDDPLRLPRLAPPPGAAADDFARWLARELGA